MLPAGAGNGSATPAMPRKWTSSQGRRPDSASGPVLGLPPVTRACFQERSERPHADPGGALPEIAPLAGSEGRACDVEVRPGHIAHELAEEDRRADRPAPAVTVVLDVGHVGPERLLLQIHQRKS